MLIHNSRTDGRNFLNNKTEARSLFPHHAADYRGDGQFLKRGNQRQRLEEEIKNQKKNL
jgi:hypothetical protein